MYDLTAGLDYQVSKKGPTEKQVDAMKAILKKLLEAQLNISHGVMPDQVQMMISFLTSRALFKC